MHSAIMNLTLIAAASLAVSAAAPTVATASTVTLPPPVIATVAAAAPAAGPVEHRLSPADADAAIEAGAEVNRAADALNLVRGDPRFALPGERGGLGASGNGTARADRKVHGEVGVGFGTGGGREVFGEVNAPLGDNGSAAFAYDYNQFGRRVRNR